MKYKNCCLHKVGGALTTAGNDRKEAEPSSRQCTQLVALFNAGNHGDAEQLARTLIEQHPGSGFLWLALGTSLKASGKDCLAALHKAGTLLPNDPDAQFNLAKALKDMGRLDEAAAAYRRVLQIRPNFAGAHNNLANTLCDLGAPEEAAASYGRALRIMPDYAEAHNGLGGAYKSLGRLEEATASYRRALQIKPNYAEAHGNLGNALFELDHPDDAAASYQHAVQLMPDFAEAHNGLGAAYQKLGKLDQAEDSFRRALSLRPDFAEAVANLGYALHLLGRSNAAEAELRRALSLDPQLAEAANNLAILLIDEGRPVEAEQLALQATRNAKKATAFALIQVANAQADQGRVADSLHTLESLLQQEPEHDMGWDNYLLFFHYDPDRTRNQVLQSHQHWGARRDPVQPATRPVAGLTASHRLRVAYLSPDFLKHPVGILIGQVVAAHDTQRLEILVYHDNAKRDGLTDALNSIPGIAWRDVAGLSDLALAERIRHDQIDVLVELAGHTSGNRLSMLALRPAPVQISYLGYPGTTGLAAIDYAITDPAFDPPEEANDFYTESLFRLPRPSFCFSPPDDSLDIQPAPAGRPRLGAFNTLRKLNNQVIDCWATILAGIPDAVLVMQTKGLGEEALQASLRERFATRGVDGERIEFHAFGSFHEHQNLVSGTHICLDPWPWNGHMTTLNCLWMGVPVLTLDGDRRAMRMGKCILSALGLDDLIARSPEDYVRIALAKTNAADELAALRGTLRRRLLASPLTDGKGLASALEDAYFRMYQNRQL